MIVNEVEKLSREEMIAMLVSQAEEITALQRLIQTIQTEYTALKLKVEQGQKPSTNSKNSSQPPSLDRKKNKAATEKKRKHGPPEGHVKYERNWVAEPDRVVAIKATVCSQCQCELCHEVGDVLAVNQITELPASPAEVIEVRQYGVVCPGCGSYEVTAPPAGLEMNRTFGVRLESTIVYYRQEQHLSYQRTQEMLRNLHGVEISQGGIDQIMQRAGGKAAEAAQAIQEQVRESPIINSDETGVRVAGRNWWQWVFCTAQAVLHIIDPSRAAKVIEQVMETAQAQVWGSDCLPAQLKASSQERQLCLAHQLRNLQAVIDRYPTSFWPRAFQALFRAAIHLSHQRLHLSPQSFDTHLARIERLCDGLLRRLPSQPEARKLHQRYLKHRQSLFVFLYHSDVPPTNNVSERALRHSVVHRKVLGGFRSQWGAKVFAALASVIDSAALKGIRPFDAILSLLGQPALPLTASP